LFSNEIKLNLKGFVFTAAIKKEALANYEELKDVPDKMIAMYS